MTAEAKIRTMSLANSFLLLVFYLSSVGTVAAETQATSNTESLFTEIDSKETIPWLSETTNAESTPKTTYLGGDAFSKPCCVSWGPGRVDCFIRDQNSNVLHKTIVPGCSTMHTEWTNLGGLALEGIEAVSRGWGLIDLIVVDADNQLHTNSLVYGEWTGWGVRPNAFAAEVPTCVAKTPTIVNCMYRDLKNKGWNINAVEGTWQPQETVDGVLRWPMDCIARFDRGFEFFGVGVTNVLWIKWWVDGWSDWVNLNGTVKGQPSVTAWDQNRIDVFVLGMLNDVRVKSWNGLQWLDWISLGGAFKTEPECVTTGVGKIHCFAIGPRSRLYRNSQAGGAWSGWIAQRVGFKVFLEKPSCLAIDKDEVACYVRNSKGRVIQLAYQF